ncbi:MAG: Fe-S-binding domain-containing protein, partial [Gemmatimonadales bacterium]
AATVVVFSAAYLLWSTQRVFFNRLTNPANEGIGDLNLRELAVVVPLIATMIWVGLYPAPLLKRTEGAARHYVEMVQPALPPARMHEPGARP